METQHLNQKQLAERIGSQNPLSDRIIDRKQQDAEQGYPDTRGDHPASPAPGAFCCFALHHANVRETEVTARGFGAAALTLIE